MNLLGDTSLLNFTLPKQLQGLMNLSFMIFKKQDRVLFYQQQETVVYFSDSKGNFLKKLLIGQRIEDIQFSEKNNILLLGIFSKEIKTIELNKLRIGTLLSHHSYILTMSLTKDEQSLIVFDCLGNLIQWDLENQKFNILQVHLPLMNKIFINEELQQIFLVSNTRLFKFAFSVQDTRIVLNRLERIHLEGQVTKVFYYPESYSMIFLNQEQNKLVKYDTEELKFQQERVFDKLIQTCKQGHDNSYLFIQTVDQIVAIAPQNLEIMLIFNYLDHLGKPKNQHVYDFSIQNFDIVYLTTSKIVTFKMLKAYRLKCYKSKVQFCLKLKNTSKRISKLTKPRKNYQRELNIEISNECSMPLIQLIFNICYLIYQTKINQNILIFQKSLNSNKKEPFLIGFLKSIDKESGSLKQVYMTNIFDDDKLALLYQEIKEEIHKRKKILSKYLIKVEDVFIYQNRIFIILEHDCYGTMKSLMENLEEQKKLISEKHLQNFLYYLFKIVMNQHQQGRVMRNISEDSIFITKNQELKFLDLNLGKNFIKEQEQSQIYCSKNSHLIAPEIIQGQDKYSFKSDIWTLGIICVYLIDGKFPFKNKDQGILFEIINKQIKPNKKISSQLQALLEMMLQKDPKKRATIDQLLLSEFIRNKGDQKQLKEFVRKTFHQSKDFKNQSHFKTKDIEVDKESQTKFFQILFLQKKLNQQEDLTNAINKVELEDEELIENIFKDIEIEMSKQFIYQALFQLRSILGEQ